MAGDAILHMPQRGSTRIADDGWLPGAVGYRWLQVTLCQWKSAQHASAKRIDAEGSQLAALIFRCAQARRSPHGRCLPALTDAVCLPLLTHAGAIRRQKHGLRASYSARCATVQCVSIDLDVIAEPHISSLAFNRESRN